MDNLDKAMGYLMISLLTIAVLCVGAGGAVIIKKAYKEIAQERCK